MNYAKTTASRTPSSAATARASSTLLAHASDRFGSFWLLLIAMALLFAASWPAEWSLDLWVFKDRGSLLKVDELVDMGLRLGVDTFYSYGLLPILLQRALFTVFGRGAWPLMLVHIPYVLLSAWGWTLIARELPHANRWAWLLIVLVPILIWVNPNLPYVLVQLSLLFSIALLLRQQYAAALAVSAVGCWSVPTVTLLASGLLLFIAVAAWLQGPKTLPKLWQLIGPGAMAYLGLGALLAAFFGWRSVLATALPLQGMAEYQAIHYGMFTTLVDFLHPHDVLHGSYLRYYVLDRATWWLFSNALLLMFGAMSAWTMIRARRMTGNGLAVVVCAVIEAAFVLVAYGSVTQHIIYDPLVVLGVMVGLGTLPLGRSRVPLLIAFVALSLASLGNQAAYTYSLWTKTHRSSVAPDFYAPNDVVADWSAIVELSKTHPTMGLSYSTGIQHYYPKIRTPAIWTVQIGMLMPADKARLMDSLNAADLIVEDLSGPTQLFEVDPDVKRELDLRCRIMSDAHFIVWSRSQRVPERACIS